MKSTYNYDSKRIIGVLSKFGVNFDSFRIETFQSGHINSTFKVDVRSRGKAASYVLQRINTYVFPNPVGIMENIDKVTGHIRKKLIAEGEDPQGKVFLLPITSPIKRERPIPMWVSVSVF